MTDSPSEATAAATPAAAEIAALVGAEEVTADFGTVKARVPRHRWVEAVTAARDGGYDFFSWLSAIDWSREVAVGDPVADPDGVEERYEVLCRLSTTVDARHVHLATDVPKDDPVLPTLIDVFGGAAWHERETAEMFGISFAGHPNLENLYLPDAFEGHPLRKTFPLLSRDVKPWPGTVDVEDMPSTENPER